MLFFEKYDVDSLVRLLALVIAVMIGLSLCREELSVKRVDGAPDSTLGTRLGSHLVLTKVCEEVCVE